MQREFDVDVHIFSADLSNSDGCQSLATFVSNHGFYVESLVNNAGVGVCGEFIAQEPASLLRMVDLNLRSSTELITLFLPDMIERKKGGVLNVASMAGMGPVPFLSVYAATKSYMVNLTTSLREELRGTGVKMSVLAPGPVDTAFHEDMGNSPTDWMTKYFFISPEAVARVGFNGFIKNQRVIVPGLINTLAHISLKLFPHRLVGFANYRFAIRASQLLP